VKVKICQGSILRSVAEVDGSTKQGMSVLGFRRGGQRNFLHVASGAAGRMPARQRPGRRRYNPEESFDRLK